MTSCQIQNYKDIEDFKGVDHLYINPKFNKQLSENEIGFVTDLVNDNFENKHQFTQKTKELQKKYSIKPRQSRLNLVYRTLLQEKKL